MRALRPLQLVVLLLGTVPFAGEPTPPSDAARVLEIPGFDFRSLAEPAKKELASVLTDEFDYCGRPVTLAAALRKPDVCKHTKRMAAVAAAQAAEGSPATEIIVSLTKYNQSFAAKRTVFKPDERMCMGPKDAKVAFVEFSDFECPFCAMARPMLEEFVKAHPNTQLCYQPYPLPQHPHAVIAAQAALFARDNGKFWLMHDALFENQLSLSEPFIKELGKKLSLDVGALGKVLGSQKYVDEMNLSKEAGKRGGADSTPTLFVNGRKMTLGFSPEALATTVDDELDWIAGHNAWASN